MGKKSKKDKSGDSAHFIPILSIPGLMADNSKFYMEYNLREETPAQKKRKKKKK